MDGPRRSDPGRRCRRPAGPIPPSSGPARTSIVSPPATRTLAYRGIKQERYRHFGVPEYWVVDGDRRVLEVWDRAGGAEAPVALEPGHMLTWSPSPEGPTLEVDVGEVLGPA